MITWAAYRIGRRNKYLAARIFSSPSAAASIDFFSAPTRPVSCYRLVGTQSGNFPMCRISEKSIRVVDRSYLSTDATHVLNPADIPRSSAEVRFNSFLVISTSSNVGKSSNFRGRNMSYTFGNFRSRLMVSTQATQELD
jgi:hypothetical protein